MISVLTVVGARPQLVKASTVSQALAERGGFSERLVHTGQHFDTNMSQVFFDELGMRAPDVNLGIHGGGHGEMTGRMLEALEAEMGADAPDVVLVYGDTNSTLAGALGAAKLGIPVAHVEAGLRSFNRAMPEEINRVVADHLSEWLFAPTADAVANLEREGIDRSSIFRVGDVMYDVALAHAAEAERRAPAALTKLGLAPGSYVLVTVHRAENTDSAARLGVIVRALLGLSDQLPVVWPIHPRASGALREYGLDASGIQLIDPVGYLDMVCLERHAAVIATDSGGVQKEAYFHGVPCITLRDETEWIELLAMGWNRLVPPHDPAAIVEAVVGAVGTRGSDGKPYGDGHASHHVASALEKVITGGAG